MFTIYDALYPQSDGMVQTSQAANNFHSRIASGDSRGSSPGRQGAEGGSTKPPLSKAVSSPGMEAVRRPAGAEARPHSAETKDTLKRDKLAEEVERIAVCLMMWMLFKCVHR